MDEGELYELFDVDPGPIVALLSRLSASLLSRETRDRGLDVLDIGCGTGRMFEPLAKLGHRVVGMEPHPKYRARAERRAGVLEVRSGGFAELADAGAFDLIIAANGPFAYVLDPADRERALRNCFAALRPGGILFLDVPNMLRILKEYQPPAPYSVSAGGREIRLTRSHELDYTRAIFTTVQEYLAGEERTLERHAYAILTRPEVVFALERCGFRDAITLSDYRAKTGQELVERRMILVARKPSSGPAEILSRVAAFAWRRPDVRAAALVGSRARGTHRPDSDLDVIMLVEDPRRYLDDDTWSAELGASSIIERRSWGLVEERRMIIDGFEVELNFGTPAWTADSETPAIVRGALNILHDPDGRLAALTRP